MIMDSTVRPGRGQRILRRTRSSLWQIPLVTLLSCVLGTACGGAAEPPRPPASPSPTTIAEAYDAAHPNLLPPGLKRLNVGERELARRIRARLSPASPVLLPTYLPPGYGLAAPFISVGSGAVLPNPQVWGSGYRVSYTDLRGMITVMVGAQRRPGKGPWKHLSGAWHGRGLAVRRSGALTVVTVSGNDPVITVSISGADRNVAVRVLISIHALATRR